jgi:galactosylceramidase
VRPARAMSEVNLERVATRASPAGTSTSHAHSAQDRDFTRGMLWWAMKEAKARNPSILFYGLAWTFPGWVGSAYGAESAEYLASWLDGARDVHNLTIDFVGLSQNEKPTCIPTDTGHQCGSTLSKRAVFDAHGHHHVQIVAPDAFIDNVEQLYGMVNHSSEVDIFGMHGEADLYETYGASVSADPWLTSGDHPLFISENEACYSGIRSLARCARCVNIYR